MLERYKTFWRAAHVKRHSRWPTSSSSFNTKYFNAIKKIMDSVFLKVSTFGDHCCWIFEWNHIFCFTGGSTDRDSEDGRPLSLVNRRPSISAPISSRKPSSSSRVHTPPLASPGFCSGDGASSTPKRLTPDGKWNKRNINERRWLKLIFFSFWRRWKWQFRVKTKHIESAGQQYGRW